MQLLYYRGCLAEEKGGEEEEQKQQRARIALPSGRRERERERDFGERQIRDKLHNIMLFEVTASLSSYCNRSLYVILKSTSIILTAYASSISEESDMRRAGAGSSVRR